MTAGLAVKIPVRLSPGSSSRLKNKAAEPSATGHRSRPGFNFNPTKEAGWIEKAAGLLYKTFLSSDWKG